MNLSIQVLISCMNQKDHSIINQINPSSDVIIVNQCDNDSVITWNEYRYDKQIKIIWINSSTKGLSKSRNIAISHSTADIILFCDDDEILESDYVNKISESFKNSSEDIIAFKLILPHKICFDKTKRINLFNAGKISSVQIALKRESVLSKNILFCEKMGSGTGNGAGEENKFLCDCLRAGLSAKYEPILIGKILPGESQWFSGYNKKYWIDRGWSYKMIHGKLIGYLFILFAIVRAKNIDNTNNIFKIYYWLNKGFFLKR